MDLTIFLEIPAYFLLSAGYMHIQDGQELSAGYMHIQDGEDLVVTRHHSSPRFLCSG
jgi:hypothetical protein